MCIGQKAFEGDFAVREYAMSGATINLFEGIDFVDERFRFWTEYLRFASCLQTWIQEALSREPGNRPSAATIGSRFWSSINRGMAGMVEDN